MLRKYCIRRSTFSPDDLKQLFVTSKGISWSEHVFRKQLTLTNGFTWTNAGDLYKFCERIICALELATLLACYTKNQFNLFRNFIDCYARVQISLKYQKPRLWISPILCLVVFKFCLSVWIQIKNITSVWNIKITYERA